MTNYIGFVQDAYYTNLTNTLILSTSHIEDFFPQQRTTTYALRTDVYYFIFSGTNTTTNYTSQPDPGYTDYGAIGNFWVMCGTNCWDKPFFARFTNTLYQSFRQDDENGDWWSNSTGETGITESKSHFQSVNQILDHRTYERMGSYKFGTDKGYINNSAPYSYIYTNAYTESGDPDALLLAFQNGQVLKTSAQTNSNGTTKWVEMPHMSILVLDGTSTNLNYAPLPGAGAGSSYLDVDQTPSSTFMTNDNFFEVYVSTNGPGFGGTGARPIVWYGTYADELNGAGVGNSRASISGYSFNPATGPRIGEIITYSVLETRPPAPSVNDDLWSYCYQVAAQLGSEISRATIYEISCP